MSPVSRGRRRKKTSTSPGRRTATANAERPGSVLSAMAARLGVPAGLTQWFGPATTAVLDQAHVVLDAQHPRALEQLTSQLIGAQVHQAFLSEHASLSFDRWFLELVSATESRVREQADGGAWDAPLRLLHGLAAIGSRDVAQLALATANRLRKLVARVPGQDPGPRWPLDVRRFQADGDVVRLRDVWGTRYAVIAGFSYGGRDRSVFLLDVDTDFYNIVVGAGDFDDTEQAAATWRQQLGATAADARVEPVHHIDQLDCLMHLCMDPAALPAVPARSVTDNWFSAQRRLAELRRTLRRSRTAPIVATSLYNVDTDPAVDEFAQWYAGRHGTEPDHETVEAVADQWMSGVIPETWFAASPARLHHQCELISDWFYDEPRRSAFALLPDWVDWLAERAGYGEPFRTQLADAVTNEIAHRT